MRSPGAGAGGGRLDAHFVGWDGVVIPGCVALCAMYDLGKWEIWRLSGCGESERVCVARRLLPLYDGQGEGLLSADGSSSSFVYLCQALKLYTCMLRP